VAFRSNSLLNAEETAKRNAPGLADYGYGVVVSTVRTGAGAQVRITHTGQLPWGARTTLTQFADDSTLVYLVNTENAPAGRFMNANLRTPQSRFLEAILMRNP
jgi:hypothetical protein